MSLTAVQRSPEIAPQNMENESDKVYVEFTRVNVSTYLALNYGEFVDICKPCSYLPLNQAQKALSLSNSVFNTKYRLPSTCF
jgi:hypothetical protein